MLECLSVGLPPAPKGRLRRPKGRVGRELSRVCSACGGQFSFVSKERGRHPKFCSDSCRLVFRLLSDNRRRRFCGEACARRHARRIAKAKRQARERTEKAESVNPFKVFTRDGWRCYLCGVDTPRSLRGTNDPRAPELEHVVPLARGGAHTYENTACACRACNGAKGASLPAAVNRIAA